LPQELSMDLNFQLMREQIALHGAGRARSPSRREGHRLDARMIRRMIDFRYGTRSPFPPVSA
jgi:hypothetical protein